MKKLYIKTYGCQMNVYDSEYIQNIMKDSCDVCLTASPEEADIILLNTCSIREKAVEKVFSDLGRWRLLKKKKPSLVIGVGGCVASLEGANIIKRAPYVNFVFGPQTLHRLPKIYSEALLANKSVDTTFPEIEKFDHLPKNNTNSVTSFVTIMEGCNKYCSYCIVPFTRGKEVSRKLKDVLCEVEMLAQKGVKEITFLGQNVNDYAYNLAILIRETAKIDEIKRIRFTTSYPSSFSEDLIEVFEEKKLANHIHIPVQSGSDKILKMMKRRYTAEEFTSVIEKIRKIRKDISITSDFIVGFPGETKEDFNKTLGLVKEINFDASFSFIYSPRPKTSALKLPDNVSLKEKKIRLQILQKQLDLQAFLYSKNMVNTSQKVLVTGFSKKDTHELTGRTENNRIVNFSGEKTLIGQIVNLKIQKALKHSLKAELLN